MIRILLILTVLVGAWLPMQSAEAATAFVQGCGFANGGGSTTIACTMTNPMGAGNTLAVAVAWDTTTETLSSCSDGTNTYVLVANTLATDATNTNRFQGAYALNGGGATLTITCTISAAVSGRGIVVHEISGTLTSGALDVSIGQNQQNPGTGTDAITSTAVTTTENGDYIFGASNDAVAGCATLSAGTNYTIRTATNCAPLPVSSENQIQSAAGSIAATFTGGSATDDWSTLIMAFKPAAGVASNRNLMLMGVGP